MNNNTDSSHLGIDVAKLRLDVSLLTPAGTHAQSFANTDEGFAALDHWLKPLAPTARVCLEATGLYSLPVTRFLHARGLTVSLVNPLAVHHFARSEMSRNKTDAHDATLLARFSREKQPRAWQPPSAAREQLQALVRAREQLLDSRILAQQHLASAPALVAPCFTSQLEHLRLQIKKLEQQIKQAVQANPQLDTAVTFLTSIPGLGLLTAVTVLSIMPEIDQLENARQLAAFAGVNPARHQSGPGQGWTRMSKCGHARLRKSLYFPAVTALRCNPRAQALAIRLAQKGKPKMVILGAIMRLLTHLIYGVLKNQTPFDPHHQPGRHAKSSPRAAASPQLAPGGG